MIWLIILILQCNQCLSKVSVPIATVLLNHNWTLLNENQSILITNLSLPMSVHTALRRQNLIDDPLFGLNDIKLRWISMDNNWVFENYFASNTSDSIINLVFDSIDTIASVYLNNKFVLFASNQFLRYELFNMSAQLNKALNHIQIKFASPIRHAEALAHIYPYRMPPECPPQVQHGECHVNFLRKQQCSFSWDWGPAFAPIGLGQVRLDSVSNFDFNFSLSVYPTGNGTDLNKWNLDIDLNILVLVVGQQANVKVNISDLVFEYEVPIQIMQLRTFNRLSLYLDDENIKLWWPNGYGEQNLYTITIKAEVGKSLIQKSKTIGFRSVELVQEPVSEDAGLTFYFRINHLPIFLKGSNWIPPNVFQELTTLEYLTWLLESSRDANMNVLRVWGGGTYESEEFYELTDRLGIMIWQDFMFACSAYPTNAEFIENVRSEVVYQVSRLRHHPSIIIWSGNNENEAALSANWYLTDSDKETYAADYRQLYIETIMHAVQGIDPVVSRPFLSSSPTNGKETIAENWIAKNPYDLKFGDMHFYDYKMNGWLPESFPIPRFMSEVNDIQNIFI